jgi:PKD repeat protein
MANAKRLLLYLKNSYLRAIVLIFMLLGQYGIAAACNGVANFTFPNPHCLGSPVTFTNTSTGGANSYTWVWGDASGNTTVSSTASQTHTYATAGTYTVSLIRTFGNGCVDTLVHTVNIVNNPPPSPTFTFSPNNSCSQNAISFNNTTNPTSGLSFAWNFGDPSSGNQNTSNNNNPNHTFNAVGTGNSTYTVTLTSTNNLGCSSSSTQTVTVGNRPDAALSDSNLFSPFNNCAFASTTNQNYSITLLNASSTQASNANYTISWGDASPNFTAASFTSASHTYSALGIYTILLTVTGTNGCVDTASYQVVNLSNPSVGLTGPGNTSGCAPQTYTFTLAPDIANAAYTSYTFDFGDNTPLVTWNPPITATTISHTYNTTSCGQPGNQYTVKVTARNACDSTMATVNAIKISSKPTANFNITPNPGCVNVPVTFINTTAPGCYISGSSTNSTTSYVWNFGDSSPNVTTSSSASQSHIYTAVGSYTVTLTASNPCGSTTMTKVVNIIGPPLAAFTNSPPGCAPTLVTTNNTSVLDSLTYSWNVSPGGWNFANNTNSTSINPQFNFTAAGTYTITLTVSNPCGVSTVSNVITVKSIPSVSLSPIPSACGSLSLTPSVSYTNGGGTISSYNWSFTGGSPSTSTSQNPTGISYTAPGTYTVTVTATNECGSSSDNKTFTINPLPNANAGTDISICAGSSTTIGTPATGGNGYSWSSIPSGFGSFQANPTVAPVSTTTFIVSAITPFGCTKTDTVVVTVNPAPIVTAGSPQTVCVNTAPFSLTGATPAGGTWSGTGVSAGGTFTPSTAGAGTFTLTYTYTGTGGCTNSATVNITVDPLPIVNAGNGLVLCNQPGTVTLTGYSPAGGTWSGTGVTSGGVFDPSAAGVGNFTLTYTYANGNGCLNTDTIHISVINPTPASAGPDDTVCVNSAAIALAGFAPSGGTWSGPGITNASGTFTPSAAGAGVHNLVYTFGTGTCITRDTLKMTVNPLPVVTAGANQSICIDAAAFSLAGATPAGGTWSGTGVTAGGIFTPSTTGAGTHTLTYSYIDPVTGCSNSATKTITVNPLPVVNAGSGMIVCNQPVTVTLSGYTPAGGTWSGTGVTSGGVFDPSIAGNGTHVLTYTFSNSSGCVNTDTIQMTVVPPAIAQAGIDDTVCVNAAPFTFTGFTPAGGTWSGTGITAGGIFTPSTAGAGTHTLTYSYGSGTCLSTDTKTIIVNPLPTVSAGAALILCVSAAPFNLSGNSPAGGTWTGTGITNAGAGTFDASVAGVGTFTITYTYTDPATGCSNSATRIITVNGLPVVNAGTGTVVCDQPIPFTLNGYTPAGGTWSGTGVTTGGTFNPSTAGVGTHTLTYTFSNGNGCTNTDTIQMTVIPPAVAQAGADDTVCVSASIFTLAGFTPAGGSWSGTGVTTTGSFDPGAAGPGTHTLTYTYGAGTCLTTDTKTILVNPLPVVNAGNAQTVCVSTPAFNLAGYSPAGGIWSGTGITNASAGTFDPATAGAGTHVLTYSYTDPNTGCTNTSTRSIVVGALPVPSFTNPPQGCIGVPVSFTNNTTGATLYSWSFGDAGLSNVQSPSHSYASTGTYTIQLIAETSLGCRDSITSSIDIYQPPQALFALAPDSGCGPLTVNFQNLSSGALITYQWNFGNGQTSTLQSPGAVTYQQGLLSDTTYHITLAVTNFCGTVTYSDSVVVRPIPTVNFGTDVNSGCSPLTIQFNDLTVGNATNYLWDFGDGTTGTGAQPLNHTYFTGTQDSTYYITLIASNQCGSDTMQHSIIVHPNTVTSFFNTSVTSGCVPLTVNFTNYATGGNNISWDFGDGNISNQASPTHTYTVPGTYTVSQFVNNGCSYDTSTIQIQVNPLAGLAFTSAPVPTCVNQPITFTNTSTNSSGYLWDFGDNTTSSLTSPSHAYTAAGTYTVTLSGTSVTYGCPASITATVSVTALPVPQFAPDVFFGCAPLTVNFQNNSSNSTFYSWNFGDSNTSALTNPSHTYSNPGMYTVTLVAQNLAGCLDSITVQINVYPKPSAAFTSSSATSCSIPVTVNLTNNSTGATGYAWDFGNTQTSTLNSPSVTYTANGTYDIQLIATNTFGCTDTAIFTYGVYPTPIPAFTPNGITGCEDFSVTFTNQTQFGTIYHWDFGDGDTAVEATPTHIFDTPGTYTVTLIATSAANCSDTLQFATPFVVYPTPVAGFTYQQLYTDGIANGTIAFTNSTSGGTVFDWAFGDGLSSTDVHPEHQFPEPGDYNVVLIAENQYNCADTLSQLVTVDYFQGLYVPNAFIPSSQFIDLQTFLPRGKSLKEYHIQVYNTWGTLLWESTELDQFGSPSEGWDGTYNGEPCQQDTYVWKVQATFRNGSIWGGKKYPTGEIKPTGTISLIR